MPLKRNSDVVLAACQRLLRENLLSLTDVLRYFARKDISLRYKAGDDIMNSVYVSEKAIRKLAQKHFTSLQLDSVSIEEAKYQYDFVS